MKCDANCNSGKQASVFFSHIEDGKIRTVNLCKTCAVETGVDDPTSYSLMDVLQDMGEETVAPGYSEVTTSNELSCDACGFTQADFKKTGRFGCARCYQVFNDGLESLLEAMHKYTKHTGKVPSFVAEEGEEIGFTPGVDQPAGDLVSGLNFNLAELDEVVEEDVADEIESPNSIGVQVTMLQDQLDIAISDEDYEEAARIRDQITNLQNELEEG